MPNTLTVQLSNGSFSYNNITQSDNGGSTTDATVPISFNFSFASGTAAGQADQAYRDYATLVNTAKTYTLSALPNSADIVKVRGIFIKVISALGSGGTLTIAPAVTHGWTGIGTIELLPGSQYLVTWPEAAGMPVAVGVTDALTFTVTGTVAYFFGIIGTSV